MGGSPGSGSSIKFKETPCPMKKNGLVLCTHYTLNATAKDCMGIKFYNKLKRVYIGMKLNN